MFDGMPNVFMTNQPDYLETLLGKDKMKDLQSQSFGKGLLTTAISYLAQPKTQGYGSILPYVGKAFGAGMETAQGTYDKATQDYITKTKLLQEVKKREYLQKVAADQPQLANILQAFPESAGDILKGQYTNPNSYNEWLRAKTPEGGGTKLTYEQFLEKMKTFNPYRAAEAAYNYGEGGGMGGGSGNLFPVQDPSGKTHYFPSQPAADAFRKQIGVK